MQRDPDAPTPPEADMPAPAQETSPPHDALLLPLIHELIQPYVRAATEHGPIPPLRSDQWLDAHPDQQIAHLLIMGAANAISAPHQVIKAVLYQAEADIRSHPDHPTHSPPHVPYAELERRRYPWLKPGERPGRPDDAPRRRTA